MRYLAAILVLSLSSLIATAGDGRHLAHRDEINPYYPALSSPKLITPQWVGEEGVEAVVILGIDDMRDPSKYDAYLRPILQRLKQIDGRAPVSIMTNRIKPDDPQLQSWLDEGLSIEAHTIDHPCPLLKDGDFAKSKSTYDRCVDLLNQIPGNKPVAFRTPCCDSLNTVSPRFFSEIFSKETATGNYLQIDTSVFNFFTSEDADLPRDLVLDSDGNERFLKYIPKGRGFVNYIENYPYPYVVNKLCWEFPCVAPSDWSAQHLHGVNNPATVDDWKAALDATVVKQGVFCLVFHPHGWIRNDQVVELIDHAVTMHGQKVKFMTFRGAAERLNGLARLRDSETRRFVRFLDIHRHDSWRADGFLDVFVEADGKTTQSVWDSKESRWRPLEDVEARPKSSGGLSLQGDAPASAGSAEWIRRMEASVDFDGDGRYELWCISSELGALRGGGPDVFRHSFPSLAGPGFRLIDVNGDGWRDVVHSNADEYAVWLFPRGETHEWLKVVSGKRGGKNSSEEIPPIARADGTDNGFFVHGRAMYWQNEDTSDMPHLVDVRTFDQLLGEGHRGLESAPPEDRR